MILRIAAVFATALSLFPMGIGAQEGGDSLISIVDAEIRRHWKEQGLEPAERCGDAEFLRRVTLDLVGTIPSRERAAAFLKDGASDKRSKYVEELLSSDGYAEYWAEVWAGILVGFSADRKDLMLAKYVGQTLTAKLKENIPYDQLVRDLITARGRNEEDPLVLWYMQWLQNQQAPLDMAGKMSKTFLGVQIQCAQCHDHPFDKWTQEEFYGMAAFFSQVQPLRRPIGERPEKNGKKRDEKGDGKPEEKMEEKKDEKKMEGPRFEWIVRDRPRGEVKVEGSKSVSKPAFLGTGAGVSKGESRRTAFARLLTSKETKQFGISFVNRMWFHFFGRGVVDPFDDFNEKNQPSIPGLLEKVAADFVAHGYDMKRVIRAIVMSQAYQRSSRREGEWKGGGEDDFLWAKVRALTPEQILNAIFDACGVEDLELGKRGGELGKEAVRDRLRQQFRFTFADDEGKETSDFEGTIPQALLMMNGKLSGGVTRALPGSTLQKILQESASAEDRIEQMFLAVLTRPPTEAEKTRYVAYAETGGRGPAAYEDVMWTLLNSQEFLFNH